MAYQCIRLHRESITINEEVIHEILGLPNTGVDLDTLNEDSSSKILFRNWRLSFNKKKIRPTDLVKRIKDSGRAEDDFKISFMVLFVNSMAECSPMGCCLLEFLNKISNMEMISNVNRSRYIYESSRRSKRIWRRDTYDSYYAGPLTFLTVRVI